MCCEKKIYGMKYVFHGFEGVDEYLPKPNEDGNITASNLALNRWFSYFQNSKVSRSVKEVLVVNICKESAEQFVTERGKNKEKDIVKETLNALRAENEARKKSEQQTNNIILAQQGYNFILMDYDEVKKKAEKMGKEVFFSTLLHESTHLLEQYLAGDSGIYNSLKSEKRAGYSEALLISEKDRAVFNYLSETANYQKECDIGVEGLTSLVEALTYCQLTAANSWIVDELQQKLLSSIEIAQNDGVL